MMFKGYLNVHVTSYRANKGLHVKTSPARFAAVPLDVCMIFFFKAINQTGNTRVV